MLTEEKLQNFLDDLRLGKYDTSDYELDCRVSCDGSYFKLYDKKQDISIRFRVFLSSEYTIKTISIFGYWFNRKVKKFKPAFVEVYPDHGLYETFNVSDKLADSLITFAKEQVEKDKLVEQINIDRAFGF